MHTFRPGDNATYGGDNTRIRRLLGKSTLTILNTADDSTGETTCQCINHEHFGNIHFNIPAKELLPLSFTRRTDLLRRDILKAINNLSGNQVIILPTGEHAIDHDDAWLLIARPDGSPILRNKKAQKQIEKGLNPSWKDTCISILPLEDLAGLADRLCRI